MNYSEAIEVIKRELVCGKMTQDECYAMGDCKNCPGGTTDKDKIEAFETIISHEHIETHNAGDTEFCPIASDPDGQIGVWSYDTIEEAVEAWNKRVPEDDPEEIVRCKDCIHWVLCDGATETVRMCEYARYRVDENGYCGYGERRGED